MKDLIRYVRTIFNRKNTEPEEPIFTPDEYSDIENSGSVTFYWDSKSGDFQVLTKVEDSSEASSEVLGMLLSYISEGHMKGFLIQSLKLWADDSEDIDQSEDFYINTLKVWNLMNELDAANNTNQEAPVISPMDVFRLSRRDDSV
jgi:hypothetical protein